MASFLNDVPQWPLDSTLSFRNIAISGRKGITKVRKNENAKG
jgi:hypothetical protein